MDFSPIFSTLLSFWSVIPLFVLAGVVNSAWFKGLFGEFIVNIFAKCKFDRNDYHLFKNVTLPTEDGTTQIDHILVSKFGVFVIETKNLRGWIFGSVNQKMWTQQIFKHKNLFQNPLHQNHKHCKALQALLNLEDHQLHSVVVFIGDSTFKTAMPDNVTYGVGYIRYILSKTEIVLNPRAVLDITKIIEYGRLQPSLKTNRDHIQHVKAKITEKQNQKNCPKCGKAMVLRVSKKGANVGKQFWGCSAFPKCRTYQPVH